LLKAGARKTDKPALITSKIRERFFGKQGKELKIRERSKHRRP